MYPMALVCLSPLSAPAAGSFLHVGVIRPLASSCSKPDSGVTGYTVVDVTKDTDSCFGSATVAVLNGEPFVVTAELQGSSGTNQRLPCVTTQ